MKLYLVVKYVDGEPVTQFSTGLSSATVNKHRIFKSRKAGWNYANRVGGELVQISLPDRKGGLGMFPNILGQLAIDWDHK